MQSTIREILPHALEENEKEEVFGKLYKKIPHLSSSTKDIIIILQWRIWWALLSQNPRKKIRTLKRMKGRESFQQKNRTAKRMMPKSCLKPNHIYWAGSRITLHEIKISDTKITETEIRLTMECPLCHSRYRGHKYKHPNRSRMVLI